MLTNLENAIGMLLAQARERDREVPDSIGNLTTQLNAAMVIVHRRMLLNPDNNDLSVDGKVEYCINRLQLIDPKITRDQATQAYRVMLYLRITRDTQFPRSVVGKTFDPASMGLAPNGISNFKLPLKNGDPYKRGYVPDFITNKDEGNDTTK